MIKMGRVVKTCGRCGEGTLWRLDGKPLCPMCIPPWEKRPGSKQLVDDWNSQHPPGTRVQLVNDDQKVEHTRTRTPAWLLGDGTPVVSVVGRSGGYLLERISPETDPYPLQDLEVACQDKIHTLGTRRLTERGPYRYCQAGAALQKGFPAFAHFEGEVRKDLDGHLVIDQEVAERMWADIRPEGDEGLMAGWPAANVAKGLFFWLRQPV